MVAGRVCCCWVGAAERAGTVGRVGAGRAEGLDWRGMVGCGVWVCGKGWLLSVVGGERGGSRWPDGMGDILPEGVEKTAAILRLATALLACRHAWAGSQ